MASCRGLVASRSCTTLAALASTLQGEEVGGGEGDVRRGACCAVVDLDVQHALAGVWCRDGGACDGGACVCLAEVDVVCAGAGQGLACALLQQAAAASLTVTEQQQQQRHLL